MVMLLFVVLWCNNIGLVSFVLLGWEFLVLYHCTMCTRHPDFVSFAFYAIPIFHIRIRSYLIRIPNLLIILVQVSSNATSSKKYHVVGSSTIHVHVRRQMHVHGLYRRFACKHYTLKAQRNKLSRCVASP